MIKAKCRTNLDDYICPIQVFAAIPNIGDNVVVLYKGNGNKSTLKVVSITHDIISTENIDFTSYNYTKNVEPLIIVELHK